MNSCEMDVPLAERVKDFLKTPLPGGHALRQWMTAIFPRRMEKVAAFFEKQADAHLGLLASCYQGVPFNGRSLSGLRTRDPAFEGIMAALAEKFEKRPGYGHDFEVYDALVSSVRRLHCIKDLHTHWREDFLPMLAAWEKGGGIRPDALESVREARKALEKSFGVGIPAGDSDHAARKLCEDFLNEMDDRIARECPKQAVVLHSLLQAKQNEYNRGCY